MNHGYILETLTRIKAAARLFIIDELAKRGIEDVPPSHGAVLCHLVEAGGPVPVTGLVVALRRPKSTITKTTDSLERGGYVIKKSNPGDGRSWLVTLTPQGRECCEAFEDASARFEKKLCRGLTTEDTHTLVRLLREVEANLD